MRTLLICLLVFLFPSVLSFGCFEPVNDGVVTIQLESVYWVYDDDEYLPLEEEVESPGPVFTPNHSFDLFPSYEEEPEYLEEEYD